jgi:hypothetical protein
MRLHPSLVPQLAPRVDRLGPRGSVASASFAAALLLGACGGAEAPASVLQPYDLALSAEGPDFDPAIIVESDAALQDDGAISREALVSFFERSPYLRPSFLSTYAANGVTAVDAVLRAARRHRINPIVLLIRMQVSQGLISERFYPADASRVEYAFGCGCDGKGNCDAAYAGLDRQLDCLGNALRTSLREIAESESPEGPGVTAGGWGRDRESVTLDNRRVTPSNDATAALYQYDPRVGERQGNNWVVWNLWVKYSIVFNYFPADGESVVGTLGQPCTSQGSCVSGLTCRLDAPGTLCTAPCANGACPGGGACVRFGASPSFSSYCLPACDQRQRVCRSGYACREAALQPAGVGMACLPGL